MRSIPFILLVAAQLVANVHAAELAAVVQKPSADVYAEPRFDAPRVTTLPRNTDVRIAAQQGLWYQLLLPAGTPGFVRVNDVRVAYAGIEDGDANLRVLTGGKAGKGRVTETAGVRGIEESDLRSAGLDQGQLNALVAQRVDAATAAAYAAGQGWQPTRVAYAADAKAATKPGKSSSEASASRAELAKSVGGLLGSLGVDVGTKLDTAARVTPKSENELAAEEVALGPEIAGRILGARPLWDDASAQQRVNVVGRWVASQTSRPGLPWTFGVIDTPEANAFAAPGGLYELLSSDSEVAAAVAHEISHVVQRDHYNVIRKQELATVGKDQASQSLTVGNDSVAGSHARRYVEQNGATIMLTSLDREAEYRSDEAAEIYLARAGMNPLALYAVLQKLTALGSESASLAQLYKTHPPLAGRLDRIDQRGFGALQPYTMRE
jgi:beta-barrel assembly-enhancing protease